MSFSKSRILIQSHCRSSSRDLKFVRRVQFKTKSAFIKLEIYVFASDEAGQK